MEFTVETKIAQIKELANKALAALLEFSEVAGDYLVLDLMEPMDDLIIDLDNFDEDYLDMDALEEDFAPKKKCCCKKSDGTDDVVMKLATLIKEALKDYEGLEDILDSAIANAKIVVI